MYARSMAIMSPLFSIEGLNIKESLVVSEVNFVSEEPLSLACMTVCTFIPLFSLSFFRWHPTPLKETIKQGDDSGNDNMKALHPGSIPVFMFVRAKYISVCSV